jgi:hypothetical protein
MNKLKKSQRLEIYDLILTEQIKHNPYKDVDTDSDINPDKIKPTTVVTGTNYAYYVGGAIALVILALGVRGITRKFKAAAAARELSKSQLLAQIVKSAGKNYVNDKLGITTLSNNLEKQLSVIDAAAAEKAGVTVADARYLTDQLGQLGTGGLQTAMDQINTAARHDYLNSAGTDADLTRYINLSGLAASPAGVTKAKIWMPILRKVWKGKSGWNPLSATINDYKLTSFCMRNGVTVLRLINAGKLPIPGVNLNVRIALQQGNQAAVQDWLRHGGNAAISDILKTTTINNDIRNLATTTNTTGVAGSRLYFPTYKQWVGVQGIAKKSTSLQEYYKQQFSYLIWLNCQ